MVAPRAGWSTWPIRVCPVFSGRSTRTLLHHSPSGGFISPFHNSHLLARFRIEQKPGIAYLAAGLRIKGRPREHNLNFSLAYFADQLLIRGDNLSYLNRCFQRFTREFDRRQVFINIRDLRAVGASPTGSSPGPLLLHFGREALAIDR